MTDHQFLILKTLNDNVENDFTEYTLREKLKDSIGHKPFWDAFSPMDNMDFFIEGAVAHIRLSPIGQNAFNKENARRIQQDKDEQVTRTKLYHDAFLSKWQAKSFWYLFF